MFNVGLPISDYQDVKETAAYQFCIYWNSYVKYVLISDSER